MKDAFDIVIAYRIYPKISKTPFICPDDKLKLADVCLASFKRGLGSLRAKIYVLLDGCDERYKGIFRKYFREDELELIELPAIGNFATFSKQIEILLKQNESSIVCFAEDDYLYLNNAFEEIVQLMHDRSDVDFVSPYDHIDYYNGYIHKDRQKILVHGNRHWRTANSACLTFVTRKRILSETQTVLSTYSKGCHDSAVWMSLLKRNVVNPFYLLKYSRKQPFLYRIYFAAWRYNFRHLLFGKKYQLWSPMPSLSTHIEKSGLAPVIDWSNV